MTADMYWFIAVVLSGLVNYELGAWGERRRQRRKAER
jgi:hypothetical protein